MCSFNADVVCGWALGAFWSWVWCKKLDLHFLAGVAWVQFLSVTLVTLAIGGVILFLTIRVSALLDHSLMAGTIGC